MRKIFARAKAAWRHCWNMLFHRKEYAEWLEQEAEQCEIIRRKRGW